MSDSLNFGQMYENSAGDEALPTSKYDVEVTKASHKETSTGKPMIQIQAKVADGPKAGKGVFDNMVITADNDKAMYWFFKDLEAHGLGKDFFSTNPNLDTICQALVGTRACWDIGVQSSGPYAGRNEVKGKSPAAGAVASAPAVAPAVAAPAAPTPAAPTPAAAAPAVAPPAEGQPGF